MIFERLMMGRWIGKRSAAFRHYSFIICEVSSKNTKLSDVLFSQITPFKLHLLHLSQSRFTPNLAIKHDTPTIAGRFGKTRGNSEAI